MAVFSPTTKTWELAGCAAEAKATVRLSDGARRPRVEQQEGKKAMGRPLVDGILRFLVRFYKSNLQRLSIASADSAQPPL
jgi:hypothetical protein